MPLNHTKFELATAPKTPQIPRRKPTLVKPWINRMVGLFILITFSGIFWVYGFSS